MNTSSKSRAIVVGVAAGLAIAVFARMSSSPADPDVSVVDAYASESTSDSAAVYATLHNAGGSDRLLSVSTDAAATVMVHGPEMTAAGDLEVHANGDTVLSPGGAHIMLESLRTPLQPGDELSVELHFDKADPVTITVPVLSYDDVLERVQP